MKGFKMEQKAFDMYGAHMVYPNENQVTFMIRNEEEFLCFTVDKRNHEIDGEVIKINRMKGQDTLFSWFDETWLIYRDKEKNFKHFDYLTKEETDLDPEEGMRLLFLKRTKGDPHYNFETKEFFSRHSDFDIQWVERSVRKSEEEKQEQIAKDKDEGKNDSDSEDDE
jgi:hypothetical protein